MEVNCNGCGKCCFSEIPSSFYKNKAFTELKTPNEIDDRSNRVVLTKKEIKTFWDWGLGDALKISLLAGKENVTDITMALRNFPKKIGDKWYLACSFFDPLIKKCRIHDNTELLPSLCKVYPFNLISFGIKPLCDDNKIFGELDKEQIKKISEIEKIQRNISEMSFSFQMGVDYFQEQLINSYKGNSIWLLHDILLQIFGEPSKLEKEKFIFVMEFNKKVEEEFKFYKDNFDKQ